MKYDISKILDFDERFFKKFEDVGDRFVPMLASSDFPVTALTILGLIGTANSIKLAIYDLAEESDTHLYIIKILRRTLIEHYLRFYYILLRFLDEETDEVGKEYRKFSNISEVKAYINASSVSWELAGKPIEKQILDKVNKDNPELNISNKELNEIVLQWKHRSIVRYIQNNTNIIHGENYYFPRLIQQYAELSSFIHGGTFAEEDYHASFEEGTLKKQLYNEVCETTFMTSSMKVHLMTAVVKIDATYLPEMEILTKEIEIFLDQFSFG
jgi:hypothetical protein